MHCDALYPWLVSSVTTSLDAGFGLASLAHMHTRQRSTRVLVWPRAAGRRAARRAFGVLVRRRRSRGHGRARRGRSATQLEPLLERASRGEFASWAASPKRRLALIILFDQVPRNAYRGTAAAFAFDREALALTVEGLQLAADAALDPLERMFFYLPLEHAESLEAQDTAVGAFERLVARSARPTCASTARTRAGFARKHRDIIAKFGRFPHRNARAWAREHAGGDRVAGSAASARAELRVS